MSILTSCSGRIPERRKLSSLLAVFQKRNKAENTTCILFLMYKILNTFIQITVKNVIDESSKREIQLSIIMFFANVSTQNERLSLKKLNCYLIGYFYCDLVKKNWRPPVWHMPWVARKAVYNESLIYCWVRKLNQGYYVKWNFEGTNYLKWVNFKILYEVWTTQNLDSNICRTWPVHTGWELNAYLPHAMSAGA